MKERLPSILVTGASGLVGRNFLEAARQQYFICGLARRSSEQAGIAPHPNLLWIQADIGNRESLTRVLSHIQRQGGVDFILHLAAFYDFSNRDHPEYRRTNVEGTRNLLALAGNFGVRRFIFASSLVVTEFPPPEGAVTERSPADAVFPYALSKREGEEMVRESSARFPCSVVRLAAVVSDWCEYAPVYTFLSTWTSQRWNSRILGGSGKTAVPYIHVHDLSRIFLAILRRSPELPRMDVYVASPDGCTTHREMFEVATRCYFGKVVRPHGVPKPLARAGILARALLGRLTGRLPFERAWMAKYIDQQLIADSSYTRRTLGWEPTPRYHLLRRLLFLIEKLKSFPADWVARNQTALTRDPSRPNLAIHESLVRLKEDIIGACAEYVLSPERTPAFPRHQAMGDVMFRRTAGLLFDLLAAAVRTGDRMTMLNYVRELAEIRLEEGFGGPEVCGALTVLRDAAVPELLADERLLGMEQSVFDNLFIPVQMAVDEVEDAQEDFTRNPRQGTSSPASRFEELERIAGRMEAFYQPVAGAETAPLAPP